MTSQTSSADNRFVLWIKNQLMLVRIRVWVVALIALYTVIQYIVLPIVIFGGSFLLDSGLSYNAGNIYDRVREIAHALLGYYSGTIFCGAFVLAIITGIQGFSYLYKVRSIDFFDSQPVSYVKRFFNNYFNGIFIFAIATLWGTVVSSIITAIMGIADLELFVDIWYEALRAVGVFAGVYSVTVLASVLAGNVFIAVLLDGFLLSAEVVVRLLLMGCRSIYYTTKYDSGDFDFIMAYSSPIVAHWREGIISVIQMLAIIVVFTVLALIAFKMRPREHAGKGLCFSFIEVIVKFVIALSAGIIAAITVDEIFDSVFGYNIIFFFWIAFVVTLCCLVGEAVFNANVVKAVRRAWQIPVLYVLTLVIMISFKQDFFGYDSYLPRASRVESAMLCPDRYDSDFYIYKDGKSMHIKEYMEEMMYLQDTESVLALADVGMEYKREYEIARSKDTIDEEGENKEASGYDGWESVVMYRMKNGKQVYRKIRIPYSVDANLMDAVIGSEDYKKAYYHLDDMTFRIKWFEDNSNEPINMSFGTYDADIVNITVDSADVEEFAEAYEKDLEQYDYSYTLEHNVVGNVKINAYDDQVGNMDEEYAIYEGYDNTIALLKRYKIYTSMDVNPDDITALGIKEYFEDDYELTIVKSKSDIEEIVSYMNPVVSSVDWQKDIDGECYYVCVAYKNWEDTTSFSYDSVEDYLETTLPPTYMVYMDKIDLNSLRQ